MTSLVPLEVLPLNLQEAVKEHMGDHGQAVYAAALRDTATAWERFDRATTYEGRVIWLEALRTDPARYMEAVRRTFSTVHEDLRDLLMDYLGPVEHLLNLQHGIEDRVPADIFSYRISKAYPHPAPIAPSDIHVSRTALSEILQANVFVPEVLIAAQSIFRVFSFWDLNDDAKMEILETEEDVNFEDDYTPEDIPDLWTERAVKILRDSAAQDVKDLTIESFMFTIAIVQAKRWLLWSLSPDRIRWYATEPTQRIALVDDLTEWIGRGCGLSALDRRHLRSFLDHSFQFAVYEL